MNELFQKSFQISTIDTRQRLRSRNTQKESNTYALDQMGVEKWINVILKEVCLNEKQNSLAKLGLDRNQLKSAGVKDDDVTRLFRCLFVYTVGFYEMLHDIIKNYQLTAGIWKIFGILLEYTAKGDFQFTINQIQQENQSKIEELNEVLTQREKSIKLIEETSLNQIKHLQNMLEDLVEQNNALKQQRENAEIDFRQSNVAFEEEVAIRIKFEYRINEIMGVHRDLSQRYLQIHDELSEIRILYDKLSTDLMKTKKQLEQVINEKEIKENEIMNLKQTIDNLQISLGEKDTKISLQDLRISRLSKLSVNEQSISMNYEHQYHQLCMQFSKYKEDNISNLQELQKYQQNYQELKEKHDQLTAQMLSYKDQIFNLQTENKKQQLQIESFDKLESGYRSSIMQLQLENREIIEEHEKEIKSLKKTEVEYSFALQRIQVQQNEILVLNQNIQHMKVAKIHLDEQFIAEKSRAQLLQNNLDAREETIRDLEKCFSFSTQRLHTLTMELNDTENKLRIQQQDNLTAEIYSKKRIEQLTENIDNQRQELINEKDKLEALQNQFDSQRKELADIKSLYKVQVFENNNLVTKQIFSDRIISNDNQRIGEYINEITDIKQQLDTMSRKYRQLEIKHTELDKLFESEKQFLVDRYESKISDYKIMQKEMIPKMKLEDALSCWDRNNQKLLKMDQMFKKVNDDNKVLKIEKSQLINVSNDQTSEIKKLKEELQVHKSKLVQTLKDLKKAKVHLLLKIAKLSETGMQFEDVSKQFIIVSKQNEQCQEDINNLKEEITKQKQLIRRYRIQANQQQQQSNQQSNQQSKSIIDQQNIQDSQVDAKSNAPSIKLNNDSQFKQSRKLVVEQELVDQKIKTVKNSMDGMQNKLESISNTIDVRKSMDPGQKVIQQPKKLNSLKIKEELLNISVNDFTVTQQQKEGQTPLIQSRSISVSQGSKSQRSNKSSGQMDFVIKAQKNNLVNASHTKMTSKQFGKLFQITRDHYQS